METTPSLSDYLSPKNIVMTVVGITILLLIVLLIYNIIQAAVGLPGYSPIPIGPADQTPTSVDGKKLTVIPAKNVPLNSGSDYGLQFWMYIKDWDYKFGQEKIVIQRIDSSNTSIVSPKIALDATNNSLNVTVSIYPSGTSAGSSKPAPANSTSSNGDSYTCTVENVPLQSWFAVSVTVFQRNLDVYINGQLVKSAVLPGVPKPAVGDIQIGVDGGFSGAVCNVHSYPTMLAPSDAFGFHAAGTTCGYSAPSGTDTGGSSFTIFGYTFTFGIKDTTSGKTILNYTF
jgi:Concanavalin A-like lectin/glucanases superfamily